MSSIKILLFAISLMLQGAIARTSALDYSKRGVAKKGTRYIDDAITDCNRALERNPKDAKAYSYAAFLSKPGVTLTEPLVPLDPLLKAYDDLTNR